MLNFIYRMFLFYKFDLFFNLILILIFVFSKNYLEEDLIIGLFSSIILFFLFFSLKELKQEEIRQLRLNVKKVYRIQKKVLALYYIFGWIIFKNFLKYTKKIVSKNFIIKLKKVFISINLKLKILMSKLIYIKTYNLNLLFTIISPSVENVYNFNTKEICN